MPEWTVTLPCKIGDYALMYTGELKEIIAIKILAEDIEVLCSDGYTISVKRHIPHWCYRFMSKEEHDKYKEKSND